MPATQAGGLRALRSGLGWSSASQLPEATADQVIHSSGGQMELSGVPGGMICGGKRTL